MATSLDEYLWLELCIVMEEAVFTGGDCMALSGFLSQLTELNSKCLYCTSLLCTNFCCVGEVHFSASSHPVLYFRVIFLTGQFESKVDFLSRSGVNSCHATHLTFAMFELELLSVPANNNFQDIHNPDRSASLPATFLFRTRRIILMVNNVYLFLLSKNVVSGL